MRKPAFQVQYFEEQIAPLINAPESITTTNLPQIFDTNAILLVGIETRSADVMSYYGLIKSMDDYQGQKTDAEFGKYLTMVTTTSPSDNFNCFQSFLELCGTYKFGSESVKTTQKFFLALRAASLYICNCANSINDSLNTIESHANFLKSKKIYATPTDGLYQQFFGENLEQKPLETLLSLISKLFLGLTNRDGTNPSCFDLYFAACPVCHKVFRKQRFDQRFDTNLCKQKHYRDSNPKKGGEKN